MDMDDYQKWSQSTAVYPRDSAEQINAYMICGLSGEVGEVASVLKRQMRDGTPEAEFRDNMKKELGDVLWYLARMADELGFSLADVAETNKQKLMKRKAANTLHGAGDNR